MQFYNKAFGYFCKKQNSRFFRYFPRAQVYLSLSIYYHNIDHFTYYKEFNNIKYLFLDRKGYYCEHDLKVFIVSVKMSHNPEIIRRLHQLLKLDSIYVESFYYLTGIHYEDLVNFDSINFLKRKQIEYVRNNTRKVEVCSNKYGYYCNVVKVKDRIYYIHNYSTVKVFDSSLSLLYSSSNEKVLTLDEIIRKMEEEYI